MLTNHDVLFSISRYKYRRWANESKTGCMCECTCMHSCKRRGERIALLKLPSSVHSIILIGFIRGLKSNTSSALCLRLCVCVCVYFCLMFMAQQISYSTLNGQYLCHSPEKQTWLDGLTNQHNHSYSIAFPPLYQLGVVHSFSLRAEPQWMGKYSI